MFCLTKTHWNFILPESNCHRIESPKWVVTANLVLSTEEKKSKNPPCVGDKQNFCPHQLIDLFKQWAKLKMFPFVKNKTKTNVMMWPLFSLIAMTELYCLLCALSSSDGNPRGGPAHLKWLLSAGAAGGHFLADRWRQWWRRLNGGGRMRNHWPSVPAAAEPAWFPGKGNTPRIDLLHTVNSFLAFRATSKKVPKFFADPKKISSIFFVSFEWMVQDALEVINDTSLRWLYVRSGRTVCCFALKASIDKWFLSTIWWRPWGKMTIVLSVQGVWTSTLFTGTGKMLCKLYFQ